MYSGAPSRRIPRAAAALALVLVLLAGAAVTMNELGTHHRLNQTRVKLAATVADLGSTRQTLASTQADLTTRTQERDTLQQKLNSVQGELSDSQQRVERQAGQIDDLKTCLSGIGDSLGLAGNGDYSGAIAALNAVSGACQRARSTV